MLPAMNLLTVLDGSRRRDPEQDARIQVTVQYRPVKGSEHPARSVTRSFAGTRDVARAMKRIEAALTRK